MKSKGRGGQQNLYCLNHLNMNFHPIFSKYFSKFFTFCALRDRQTKSWQTTVKFVETGEAVLLKGMCQVI